MNEKILANTIPFGLLQLDATGRVLLYEPIKERNPSPSAADIIGRNFFTDIVPAAQLGEFYIHFNAFMAHFANAPTCRCTFSIPSEQGQVQVKFLLTRMGKRAAAKPRRMAMVQIRPECHSASA